MKIYLDIDGVLLTKTGDQANHVKTFLKQATATHEVYWLTTHCKGNIESTLYQISGSFDPDILPLLKRIKPTNWVTLKTEAIDFDSEFIWLDDYPLQVEIDMLKKYNKLSSLLLVDLKNKPDTLLSLLKKLE